MKVLRFLLASIVIVIAVSVGFFLLQSNGGPKSGPKQVHIELYSDPYPMIVGQMELKVALTDEHGDPIEGANVWAMTQCLMHDTPPIDDVARRYEDGFYTIPIIWPMIGQSTVTIYAEMPEGDVFSEEYEVFVYTFEYISTESRPYRSVRAIAEELANAPDDEYWLVVPMGAQEMATHFDVEDFVPSIITLSISGKDTLVIRNDDFVDNSIGPFYVAAGETLRQTFTEPAVYQGICTVNQGLVRIEIIE